MMVDFHTKNQLNIYQRLEKAKNVRKTIFKA